MSPKSSQKKSPSKRPSQTAKLLQSSPAFQQLKDDIRSSKRVLLSTHVLPDGDGLGAECALYHYLKKSKRDVSIYNPDPLPPRYQFLDPGKRFLFGPKEVELTDSYDLWIIVDTNDPRRLGKLWSELSVRAKKIVFLDHHPDLEGSDLISYPPHAYLVSDTRSSSIGELLHQVFVELKLARLNPEIALGLYVSIMTDTNSFRYARTTPEAHWIAAETLQNGVNPEEIYQSIYSSKELSHLKLLGEMLQNVKTTRDGKIAWIEMTLRTRKKYRASSDDTQSFLNLLLLLKSAEVVCLFREEDDERVRVSMKSKGKAVVNRVAMELGGGGHEFAAGFALSAPLKKIVSVVIPRLEKAISSTST